MPFRFLASLYYIQSKGPGGGYLIGGELGLHADVHDVKGIRGNDGWVHVAVVEQVANHLEDLVVRCLRELGVQEETQLHGYVAHGIAVWGGGGGVHTCTM